MIVINGNLLDTPFKLMAHQVNCKGVMGAGVAKQLRTKYPSLYTEYTQFVNLYKKYGLLGRYQSVNVGEHIIFNIFAQDNYGRDGVYTDYDAMERALKMAILEYEEDIDKQLTIAIPYGMGAGLAGGDWNTITSILENIEKELNVVFVAYKLEG